MTGLGSGVHRYHLDHSLSSICSINLFCKNGKASPMVPSPKRPLSAQTNISASITDRMRRNTRLHFTNLAQINSSGIARGKAMMPLDGTPNSPKVCISLGCCCVIHARHSSSKTPNKNGRPMDNNLFEVGLAKRKATLGAEYVEKSLTRRMIFHARFKKR